MADGKIIIDTSLDGTGFSDGLSKLGSMAAKGTKAAVTSITAVGTALIGCATYAIKVGSDFEAGMSQVEAISSASSQTVTTATGQMVDGLSALTERAKEMGASTKFSATESSEALNYMAMAGWDAQAMYDGLAGIMTLAAASGEDLAATSDIVTDALTAFKMEASESGHFADVLAQVSASANTNVGLLGETFKYVAPLCGTLGYSAEDAAIAIGLMANSGIKGSQAGTALKTALANMAAPTEKMAGAMDALGISLVDSAGESKDLMSVLLNLREGFSDLSETEQTAYASMIFGKEAMSGMLAVINASDEDFDKLTESIYACDGAAQKMADTMIDNFHGQLTILKSGVEGLGIAVYEKLQEPLKNLAIKGQEYIGTLTDAFNAGGFEGLVSAIGDVLADAVSMIVSYAPKIVDSAVSVIQAFVSGISKAVPTISSAVVDIGTTIVQGILEIVPQLLEAGAEIVTNLMTGLANAFPSLVSSFNASISSLTGIITSNLPSFLDAATQLVISLAEGVVTALPELADATLEIITSLVEGIAAALPVLGEAALQIITSLGQYLIENAPLLLDAVTGLISGFLEYVTLNLPTVIQAAITIITQLGTSLIEFIPLLAEAITSIIMGIGQFIIANLPTIIQAAIDIIAQLAKSLVDNIPAILDSVIEIMDGLLQFVIDNLPTIAQAAIEIITQLCEKLVELIPELIPVVAELIMRLFNYVVDNLPTIVQAAIQIITTLVQGLIDQIPTLIPVVIQIFSQLFESIVANLPTITSGAIQIITTLAMGLVQAIPDLLAAIPTIIAAIFDGFLSTNWGEVGMNIISGIAGGVVNAAKGLVDVVVNAAKNALNAVKSWLGIKSPSRRFRDEVGKQLLPGVETGVEETAPDLYDKMGEVSDNLVDSFNYDDIDVSKLVSKMKAGVSAEVGTINTNVSVKARSGSGQVRGTENEGFDYAAMGAAVIDAIAQSGLKVECDDREFGRLITELQQV